MSSDHSAWMERVYELIKDTPLCLVPLPGSHDSGSYGSYSTDGTAKTQSLTIKQQLARGIRFFDLRIRVHDGRFFIHHGPTPTDNDLYDRDGRGIFADVRDFVAAHPREIVILHCWDMDDSPTNPGFAGNVPRNEAFAALVDSVFAGKLIPPGADGPAQTVRQMLGQGNVIVILDFTVATDAQQRLWQQSSSIVDYYAPPTLSVPTTKIESGGNSQGFNLGATRSLLDGLKAALAQRDLRKFHKYQAIFAYDAVLLSGFASFMEYGGQRLNPLAVTEFRDLLVDAHATVPGNIIIADFVEYGGMVEAITATIRNDWPMPAVRATSPGKPASPLIWNSSTKHGWLTGNKDAEVVAGSRHEPGKFLVGLWVRGQGSYGVVDFAPVYATLAPGTKPKISRTPPDPSEWHYGHMYASNSDVRLLTPPDGYFICGIDVVQKGNHGVVNVRVRDQRRNTSAPAWSDAPRSPWIVGAHTKQPVTAIESAAQGNYGVVDLRYASRRAPAGAQRVTLSSPWQQTAELSYEKDFYGTVTLEGAAAYIGEDNYRPTPQNPVGLFQLPEGFAPKKYLTSRDGTVVIDGRTRWVCARGTGVRLDGIGFPARTD